MKKLYLLLVLYLGMWGIFGKVQAQIAYPYFPADSTRQNLSGIAIVVSDPSTYVVNQSVSFTLEVQGTTGTAIRIANGTTAYNYTPATTTGVRFTKKGDTVYVYENTVYKTTLSQAPSTAAAGITGVTGSALYVVNSAFAPVITPNYAMGDYIEMTPFITNPSFEAQFTGWVNNGLFTQGNNSFGALKEGNTYAERWVSGGAFPNISIQQLVTGLPLGKYTLRVAAQNILQNPPTNSTGGFIMADDEQKAASAPQEYSLNFLVVNGTTTIGFRTINATGNWAAVDNFRLQYRGNGQDSMRTSLQVLKDSANNVLARKMQNPVRTALTAASNAAQAILNNNASTVNELAAGIAQLRTALNNAAISNGAYVALQRAIDSARTVYGNGSGNAADTLLAVIQTNETLVNNLDAASQSLTNGVTDLYRAIFAYRVANATGSAPVVTTTPGFARGATMAFGRSTITGVNVNDLMEHGFCWSTSPQPTINDQRTTKNFWSNGFIYRVENLQPATVYYMRAYAITQNYAVGYGDVIKVITLLKGTVTFQLNGSVTSSPGNFERIRDAMDLAVSYFNNLTSIQNHHLSVNYHPGTPTAEASYGGYMQFGANPAYQRAGTALHEMSHTIGVGTHYIWHGPGSPLRQYGSSGAWQGERANNVVKFLTNDPGGTVNGDAVHMWPFGVNGAHEDDGSEFLYTAHALVHQGLGEDGLAPTGGFATPAYTFNQNDTARYYIKTEDDNVGRGVSFLAENASGQLYNKIINATNVLANDSAAWYLTFNPTTSYYQIRNVATGKYFTYQSMGQNGITLTPVTSPAAPQSFQLMGARYNTQISGNGNTVSLKAYWIVRPEYTLYPPCLMANLNASTSTTTFDFRNEAVNQRWLLLSRADVNLFRTVEGVNVPIVKNVRAASGDTKSTITWTVSFGNRYAVLRSASSNGSYDTVAANLNTARYVDNGLTNGNTYYYKLVASTDASSASSPVLATTPTRGQHLYINFNDSAVGLAEDRWGGYHATFANAAVRDSNSTGKYLRLNGAGDSYATLGEGTVSELNNFTVSTWVKLGSLADWMRIFDFGSNTNNYMFLTPQSYSSNGLSNIVYGIKNGGSEQTLSFQYGWNLDTWTHIALTQSNDSTKLYINGTMVAGTTGITLRPASLGLTSQNYLGKAQFNDPLLNGSIDEFRIYNYALNKTEIGTLAGNLPVAAPIAVLAPRVAAGDKQATLVWSYQADVRYTVLRATAAAGPYDTIATQLNVLRYIDSNRTNNTDYYYRVFAYNIAGKSPVTAAMAARPEQGRHLYISFDDNSNAGKAEETWNAFDATLAAAATRAAGRVGDALKLDGTGESFASLYGAPVSQLGNFTISAWANSSALANWMRVFDFGSGTNQYMFLSVQAGTTGGQSNVRYAIKNGGAEQIVNYPYTIPLNTWVHYAITQSDNLVKLYINGTLVASNSNVTIKPSDLGLTNQNYLGKAQFNDPMFNGMIDEFRIYNYAMTDQELQNLASNSIILAARLIHFEGKPTPAGNLLRWKVITDQEITQIQLEKGSNARTFSSIHQVSTDSKNTEQLFSYTDTKVKEPVAYYRLKMTGQNGKTTYSSVIAVSSAAKGTEIVGLYPSVVTTTTSLSVTAARTSTLTVVVSDMHGRTVQSVKKTLVPGSNLLPIDASGLSAGTYSIAVFENNTQLPTSIRFVVSR